MVIELSYIITMVFLTTWLLISALCQIQSISEWFSPYDPIGLIPRWTFFAPNPGTHDHHIVYRPCDREIDVSTQQDWLDQKDSISDWKQIIAASETGHVLLFFWNPNRRISKTISDAVGNINRIAAKFPEMEKYSYVLVEYLIILNFIQTNVTSPGKKVQWAIVRTQGFSRQTAPTIVFISRFHIVQDVTYDSY